MENLKQVLRQEDTVLFIGSGISLWAGLPSWTGMIEELAQFVERNGVSAELIRAEARRGDLLQAASYGFDRLTKPQIGEFIRLACRYGKAKPHEIHQRIVSLGPRCFVTTNYDDLIEQSLRKWQQDRFYKPPVTNRHLTETAEIVHARAIDFIFKPHGDAGDSESIILTREQYRQLLPQGERQAALESVKVLLASRPVVYIGFGLRDPDFLYVRDLLANTYKGGTRDHYAIMADVTEPEIDYWRRNYGIHLINYPTTGEPEKPRDHSELLTLLDALLIRQPQTLETPAFDPKSPEVVLALARHASVLTFTSRVASEFSIRVHSESRQKKGNWHNPDKFDYSKVEHFLESGPDRAVLVGLPGAGKTYSLRRAAACLAENLNKACLAETFDTSSVVVPIFADLKLYQGSLNQLVSKTLPNGLPLEKLERIFKVKIFLDSFNEMPREFWENGSYEADFQSFIKRFDRARLIIGSRTSDGLSKLDLPTYCLDQIDEGAMKGELKRLGITIEGRFGDETIRLLQRPFYFQYVASGVIALPKEAHPRDFYRSLFTSTNSAFSSRFGYGIDFENALAFVAYEALNRGEETFPISELLVVLRTAIEALGAEDLLPRDIANWLVSRSLLIPYSGNRIAFVHQSITEYLAATELARRYSKEPQTLKEKLTLTRWDQALFLTLSLLPIEHANSFLKDVIKADFALALEAAKYLEAGRDEVVAKLLSEVPKLSLGRHNFDWKVQSTIQFKLPLSDVHEPELRAIIECGNSIGAVAVQRLVEIKGEHVKNEILKLLLLKRDDFNFCLNGVGRALKPFAVKGDATIIAAWADMLQVEDDSESLRGFISGASEFLSSLDLDVIRSEFVPNEGSTEIPETHARILCNVIQKYHSTEALDFAAELLLKGVKDAPTTIYFVGRFAKDADQVSWQSFNRLHINRLQYIMETSDDDWALRALQLICNARADLAALVIQSAMQKVNLSKAILLYCVSPEKLSPIFDALTEFTTSQTTICNIESLNLLKQIDLNWSGKADLLVALLKLRNIQLAKALLGAGCPPTLINLDFLDIGKIDWWLEWMLEVAQEKKYVGGYWFAYQLGGLFANYLSEEKQVSFVAEFNKTDSPYRKLLQYCVIPHFSNITTDAFNDDTISFLLADLNREQAVNSFHNHILGNTATERFITDRILPLLPEAQPPLLDNLRLIVNQAGARHGRRYTIK